MPKKGYKQTKEHTKKMSEALKGRKLSEEHINRMSEAQKGKPKVNWHNGFPKGSHHTAETKLKMSLARLGKPISEEIKKKISKTLIGKYIGEKSNGWRGGISFTPYSTDWTRSLRISIRERDRYTCQICGEKQGDRAFSIHHIDYNKLNCDPSNLITLCQSCHSKTNVNRKHWINYFIQ